MMENKVLSDAIWSALGSLKDPCMQAAGLDISLVGLGIVKSVEVDDEKVAVTMALTEPGCGFTHVLVTQIEDALAGLVGQRKLDVSFDWSEGWTEERMQPGARAQFDQARKRSAGLFANAGLVNRKTA
ncbi:metal-sulfur cluster assembly factor [Altererythrobacter sp. GH1-8]|uniref:metal-sulfur cluster assembly factor n=1 Tax=Altererythrobacter sp. GH1-8 TaxID=3349333 RepID=UPI00374DCBD0